MGMLHTDNNVTGCQSQYTVVKNSVHTFTGDYPVALQRKHAYRNSFHSPNEISRLA